MTRLPYYIPLMKHQKNIHSPYYNQDEHLIKSVLKGAKTPFRIVLMKNYRNIGRGTATPITIFKD